MTSRTVAGGFIVCAATICCWTSAMGAAAANGAGHALLDGITAVAVVSLGCIGVAAAVRAKRRSGKSTRALRTAANDCPAQASQEISGIAPDAPSDFATRFDAESDPVVPSGSLAVNQAPESEAVDQQPVGSANISAASLPLQDSTKRACLAIAQAHDLSLRERDVLDLMATGMTGKEIAAELTLSYNTVKSHIRHIYDKLDVHRKQDLADLIESQRQALQN